MAARSTIARPRLSAAWRASLWTGLFAAMAYWLVWALRCPVTNTDSLTFNLGRLWVLERGGLLHNPACSWDRLLTAPLAFDAVHYPFLYLGAAYELPSYLCFVGLLSACYWLVRPRFGKDAGLVTCLGMLGMPALVYQAANTKNDLAVAFGLMVWFYALHRSRGADGSSRTRHLAAAAFALGMTTGSKASGVAFGLLAGLATFISFRGAPDGKKQAVAFGMAMAVSLFLFSDWEIYAVNHWKYGNWLGEPADIGAHANVDGLRGAAANLLRYAAVLTDPFILGEANHAAFLRWKVELTERALTVLRLTDTGMMHMPWRPLNEADFARKAGAYDENTATFGLFGMAAMMGAPTLLLFRRKWDLAAQLMTIGAAAFAIVAFSVGWSPAGLRYFVAPFSFGWCGLACWILRDARRMVQVIVGILALCSAGLTIWVSVSKPVDQFSTLLRAPDQLRGARARALLERLDQLSSAPDAAPILLLAGPRADLFDVYNRLRGEVTPVNNLDLATYQKLEKRFGKTAFTALAVERALPVGDGVAPIDRQATGRSGLNTVFFRWNGPDGN